MTKLLIGILSLALLGSGVLVGVAGGLDSGPARSVSLPVSTTGRDTTTGEDTTTGATTPETTTAGTTTTGTPTPAVTTSGAEEISGPCDEAEHRNDPRCTGAADGGGNSGPGSGGGDHGDNSGPGSGGDENRSGSNSGKS